MEVDPTVPVVKNMLLLDSEGKRIAVKYYAPEWYFFRTCSPLPLSSCSIPGVDELIRFDQAAQPRQVLYAVSQAKRISLLW